MLLQAKCTTTERADAPVSARTRYDAAVACCSHTPLLLRPAREELPRTHVHFGAAAGLRPARQRATARRQDDVAASRGIPARSPMITV